MLFPPAELERAMKVREVILRAMQGKYSWYQAADILGMSARSVRRWRQRMERHGYAGLIDRRRGRPSARRAPLDQIEKVLELYRERYRGYNVRHFQQTIRRDHQVGLSYTLVKRVLQDGGLIRKGRKRGKHRLRREPKASLGEMLHLDGSPHPWLSLCPDERQTLIAIVDDATSRMLYGQLWESESTEAVMTALKEVCAEHGLPQSLYTDRASWACFTAKAGEPADRSRLTQVGRALDRLGIEHILAYSPQARGRSERANQTLQDRLVNELRVHHIRDIATANRYLRERFLPDYNERFGRAPREKETAFMRVKVDLDQFFCDQEERMVGRDNTVVFGKRVLQLGKATSRRTCSGLRVLVRRHLDGTHSIWRGQACLGAYDGNGRPVEAAGPVDAANGGRAHEDLGRRPNGRRRPQLPQAPAAGH